MNRYVTTLRWLLICWMAGYVVEEGHSTNDIIGKTEAVAPPMACNDLVHISLDTLCRATVAPFMLLEDMVGSPLDYRIKVYYANGIEQPDIDFDYTDRNKKYNFKIWHLPTGNSCWGQLLVEDKYPPQLFCRNLTIRCGTNINPAILGFPISPSLVVKIDSISPTQYEVTDWDACGIVNLSYSDNIHNNHCDSLCFRQIVRVWIAIDESGNISQCADTICVLRPTESDIVLPRNYDNFDLPHLDCDLVFPKLPDGNPSPDFTGFPVPIGCTTLIATFTDLKIPTCGNTYKLLRRWVVLNWCTNVVTEFNQLIKVADHSAPEIVCPPDFTVGMEIYTCLSNGKIPPPDSVRDCNTWTYDVFSMMQDPKTGIPHAKGKTFIVYDNALKCFFLRGAPEGRIWIIYQVTDACGNLSECTIEIGVVDDLVPIPICDQQTVITLGIDGTAKAYAETFDDHSIDNCGIDSFLVRRMDDTCNTGTDEFGPFVRFCCADVGRTLTLALEVIDFYGNRNTCMIEAIVQDKEPPLIIPPTDITVSCSFPIDFNNLSQFGFVRNKEADRKKIIIPDLFYASTNFIAGIDGLVYDNCEATLTETFEKDIQCNIGTIRRIFAARDRQGLTDTAIQTITIINTDPFDEFDIFWPPHVEIFSCNNVQTHPDQTGYPVYSNTNCAQVAANYDDLKLIVLDSTCFKILRKWYVVDWCQYDRTTGRGYWEYTQVIAVKNSEPPQIHTCTDVEMCDPGAFNNPNTGQCMATYRLQGAGEDDCTEFQDLIWNYRIDENNDGSFGPLIPGNLATGVLPVGIHRLRWILTDQCGNISTCDQVFNLRDCKKPTPYCYNGIITVVMQGSGTVTVWAKDLNIGSFDNCTAQKDLKFSFSPSIIDSFIIYNCDSLNRQRIVTKNVRLYVTDEYGNQDYCETTIRIQDNNNVCPGTDPPGFNLSGRIRRENQDALPGTTIELHNTSGNILDQRSSDNQGNYAFLDLTVPDFYLKANRLDFISNGISIIDIILIQRHILNIKAIASPYKLLAADVNSSNTITAKDVSDLRKVILGVAVQFPNQTPVWKLIKADHQFANPLQPWDAPSIIRSEQLIEKLDQANFTGIKTGDIDVSADVNFGGSAVSRNRNSIQWICKTTVVSNSANEFEIAIHSNADMKLDGFQLGLELASRKLIIKEIKPVALQLQAEDYVIENRRIKIAYAPGNGKHIKSGEVLFRIVLTGKIAPGEITDLVQTIEQFSNEAYLNDIAYDLMLRNEEGNIPSKFIAYPAQPNPFTEEASIRFELPGTANVHLQIYDLTGKRLLSKEQICTKGRNEITLNSKDFRMNGLIYYVLTTPFGSVSERMFVIE